MAANTQDYAVIVGVNHYAGLAPLKGPDKDAKSFQEWILDEQGGFVPAENCYLILSEENPFIPIQDTIDECFGDIIIKTRGGRGRRLYFYFSGHGLGISWDDTALVLPKWTNIYRNYALSSSLYRTTLIESGTFSEIFFFFDCCRNRKIAVSGAKPLFGIPAADPGNCKSYIYSASEYNNKAYEALTQHENGSLIDKGIRGIFTESLLRGLRGAAENQGRVTTLSLADHLKLDLPRMAAQINKTQVPNIQMGDHADTVIVDGLTENMVIVIITFNTSGKNAKLEDAKLLVIKEGVSDINEQWTIQLYKGLYTIYYEGEEASAKTIRIDGTQKTVNYGI